MLNLENGIVASAAASNYGRGWEEKHVECERCGADITNRCRYKDVFERTVCRACFEEDFGDEE